MAEAKTTTDRRRKLREKLKKEIEEGAAGIQLTLDGIERSPKQEAEINEAFALTFRGALGKKVLDYLESMSMRRVGGPGIDPNVLMHIEGSRYLYGLIQTRVELGRNK